MRAFRDSCDVNEVIFERAKAFLILLFFIVLHRYCPPLFLKKTS